MRKCPLLDTKETKTLASIDSKKIIKLKNTFESNKFCATDNNQYIRNKNQE